MTVKNRAQKDLASGVFHTQGMKGKTKTSPNTY